MGVCRAVKGKRIWRRRVREPHRSVVALSIDALAYIGTVNEYATNKRIGAAPCHSLIRFRIRWRLSFRLGASRKPPAPLHSPPKNRIAGPPAAHRPAPRLHALFLPPALSPHPAPTNPPAADGPARPHAPRRIDARPTHTKSTCRSARQAAAGARIPQGVLPYGTMANTRAGKPEPSSGFGKATTTSALASGTRSRLVSSSIW
jgi:hypothetical protein